MAKVKVNVTIDEGLLERIDEYAEDNFITRSGLVQLAMSQFLTSNEATKALVEISLSLKKIAQTGSFSEDDLRQLQGLEQLAIMLSAK